ncbi:uncharacterized protein IAS62_001363 [Cryptococcus decagattii]|uniref:Uncharacterized protein n=1 Tax=Cryptococcus decagattii TaxID=1859122 RepID=A0ABZ2ASA4_9TREE
MSCIRRTDLVISLHCLRPSRRVGTGSSPIIDEAFLWPAIHHERRAPSYNFRRPDLHIFEEKECAHHASTKPRVVASHALSQSTQ